MSVSQVKKRFAEMESYLGRDKEALRRLKLLKDDVNVLRTSLAAAEEKAVEAEAVKEAARKRADEAELQVHALKAEIERRSNKNESLHQENHLLGKQLHDVTHRERVPFASGNLTKDLSPERIGRWAFKTLKEQGGTLVRPKKCTTRNPIGFDLEDILTGFDEFGFATLGRTIVLQLLLRKAVAVFWSDESDGVDPEKIIEAVWNQKDSQKARKTIMQLFLHQFDKRTNDDVLRDKTSGKAHVPAYTETAVDILFGHKLPATGG